MAGFVALVSEFVGGAHGLGAYVPLVAQVGFTLTKVDKFRPLFRERKSEQHSLAALSLDLVLYAVLVLWSFGYADEAGLAWAYIVAAGMNAAMLAVVTYYRLRPGASA